jgi:ABC-type amino acid transport substrate-binding protein
MIDDQLEHRFAIVNEPVDPRPAFGEELFEVLVEQLGITDVTVERTKGAAKLRSLDRPRQSSRPLKLLLVAALLVATAAGALLIGSAINRDDLLTRIQGSGVLRIAVRPDYPQSMMSGLAGFDVDVATRLAKRLSLGDSIEPLAVDDLLAGRGDWDLGMPSSALDADQERSFIATRPYYLWSVYFLVAAANPATAPSDLTSHQLCATAGSSGAAWLQEQLPPTISGAPAPPDAIRVRTEITDSDCLAALIAGEVDAMVTSTMSEADLATRPAVRPIGGVLFQEPRAILARRDGPDPSRLIGLVNTELSAMSADGTLTDLSRNRFGGRDLSAPSTSQGN